MGGNAFKGAWATRPVNRSEVDATVEWIETTLGLDLTDRLAGSTHKEFSSDIDVMIDFALIRKSELAYRIQEYFKSINEPMQPQYHNGGGHQSWRVPIAGDPTNGYCQVDFMTVQDLTWSKFTLRCHTPTEYKMKHRFMVLASLCKWANLRWKLDSGLWTRDTDRFFTRDPDWIAEVLLGPGRTREDLETVERILSHLMDDPKRDDKLVWAKEGFTRNNIAWPIA
mgnify:CR=1 FL=1